MERIIKIFIPSAFQVIVLSLLSALTLLAIYGQAIFARVLSGDVNAYVGQSYSEQLMRLNQIGFVRTAVIAAFWALVGLAAYGIYLIVTNAIVEARNEVVIDTEYANRGNAISSYRGAARKLGSGLVLILFIVLTGLLLLPLWSRLFEAAIFHDLTLMNVLISASGVVGLAVNLFLVWVLFDIMWVVDTL